MRCGVCSMTAKGNTPKKSLKGGIDRNGKDNCRLCCCLLKIKFREFKKTSYISSQLPELSRTMAYTTRNTVNRLTRNAPINVKPQGWGGGAGYPREFDSESLPQGRDFDTCRYPRVGNLTCPPSWKTERTWK